MANHEFRRNHIVGSLFALIPRPGTHALLYGPGYRGKTWLLQGPIKGYAESQGMACVYLDLNSLRRRDPYAQDFSAARWLFDEDEVEFQRFLREDRVPGDSLFDKRLDQLTPQGGLVIVDHLECLSRAPAITSWLKKKIKHLKERKFRVIWSERVASPTDSRIAQVIEDFSDFEIPVLSNDEISEWLSDPAQRALIENGLTPTDVQYATGRLVTLARDLRIWMTETPRGSIDLFVKRQSEKYSPACKEVFDILRQNPEELNNWQDPRSGKVRKALWLSGAFVKAPNGALNVAAPSYDARLKSLVNSTTLLRSASNAYERIGTRLDPLFEVKTHSLIARLSSCEELSDITTILRHFFGGSLRLKLTFYRRDETHPLIWRSVGRALDGENSKEVNLAPERLWRLQRGELNDEKMLTVLHNGRRFPYAPKRGETFYVPALDTEGNVDFVVEAITSFSSMWQRLMAARAIAQVISTLAPTLTNLLKVYRFRQRHRANNRMRSKLDDQALQVDRDEVLQIFTETEASFFAILGFNGREDGRISPAITLFRMNPNVPDSIQINTNELVCGSAGKDLLRIAEDARSRGLVITGGPSLAHLFPSLKSIIEKVTLFLKPVKVYEQGKSHPRLVVVGFIQIPTSCKRSKSSPYRVIEGAEQFHLGMLARRLVQFDAIGNRWLRHFDQERIVLNEIASAIPIVISDPNLALDRILKAMQSFFSVSAISISDVLTVHRGAESTREVHLRRGVGYKPGFENYVYRLDDPRTEGETAYVAKKAKVVAWWRNPSTNDDVQFEFDPARLILMPITEPIKNLAQCFMFVPERQIYCFLGAPVILPKTQESPAQVIGVLKMVNRVNRGYQRFGTYRIDSARRLASILAPLLFIVQQGTGFGMSNRLRTLKTFLGAIDHELREPIEKLLHSVEILQAGIDDPIQRFYLDQISLARQALAERIAALRSFVEFEPRNCGYHSLASLISTVCDEFSWRDNSGPMVDQSGVTDVLVFTDPSAFKVALLNLLRNAREAIPTQTIPVIKVASYLKDSEHVAIVVSDNGPGVDPAIRQNISEPFVSTKGEAAPGKPSHLRGLGLATVTIFAESFGGTCSHRRVDNETQFEICIRIREGLKKNE